MSISIGSFNFSSTIHGTPVVPPWEFTVSEQKWFALNGAYELLGSANARTIKISYEFTGNASHTALQSALATLSAAIGTIGTLVVDLGGGDSVSFTHCTFYGFQPSGQPMLDGSGVNGWEMQGELIFRQRNN